MHFPQINNENMLLRKDFERNYTMGESLGIINMKIVALENYP